ncbi:ferredoxin reductase family protein [Streptantibioticus ferralitis]|uniref:Ferredoxin reductase family protein n=1 Tax=Streptantibioticus ferralitis TaxID=236510 RepID=A0ABT5Z725_9ACTN|nr:ferredoxin reductase family protein [Streptantibioticus ferralitis]MDF2259554.1 ferredoxin reductase family protein [Streptantibioticus ferralitis]
MTTTYDGRAVRRHAAPPLRARRSPAPLILALVHLGAAGVLALWWTGTSSVVGTDGWLVGAGRIAGLLTGYTCAVLVALMARVPALERGVGSDRVARWHAMAGRWTVSLLAVHAGCVLLGYAMQDHSSLVHETLNVVLHYPDMLKGTLGAVILVAVGLLSARAVRRRVAYETWYYLHLLTYVAVFLAFFHQLSLGAQFAGNAVAQAAWYLLYGGAAGLVLWYRVLAPVRLNARHRLRVESVVREAPDVHSVLIRGERLAELGAEPGQFLRWRFLSGALRWTATPYSLSAAPRHDRLRITVKAAGGHSAALAGLRPGTRVWAEGPYGALTAGRRSRRKVLLVAGGVGITPLRALFETLPAGPGDLTLLYRARTPEDLALWGELQEIASVRGARVYSAVNGPDGRRADISAAALRTVLPDIAEHDAYLCGPPGLMEQAHAALREAGVPGRRIHHESFEL